MNLPCCPGVGRGVGVTVDGTMLVLEERLGVGSKIKLKQPTSNLIYLTRFSWVINVQLLKQPKQKKIPQLAGHACARWRTSDSFYQTLFY